MLRTVLAALCLCLCSVYAADSLPVRGLHVMAPKGDELALCLRFIDALPKEGVNTLVMEFDYGFQFKRRPEVADATALSAADVQSIAAACRKAGVRLIPQINLLGHQSWAKTTGKLLTAHPEFDETPNQYPNNEKIYCRSYCPLHPQVHDVVFDLIDEIVEATGSDAFHAGMDEVFLLGEDSCPRCKGRNKAELFAGEVNALHDHLAKTGRKLWIWGDRLIDGETTGIGEWEGSRNNTQAAIRMIPKDVTICDWHYENAVPTAAYFSIHGFPVVSCPWRKADVALRQLAQMEDVRAQGGKELGDRMQGVLQTTWCGFGPFARAYFNDKDQPETNVSAIESAACFRALFRQIRQRKLN